MSALAALNEHNDLITSGMTACACMGPLPICRCMAARIKILDAAIAELTAERDALKAPSLSEPSPAGDLRDPLETRLHDLIEAASALASEAGESVEISSWPELRAAIDRVEAACDAFLEKG